MPQFINTNISSLTTQGSLNKSQTAMQVALNRLSSGLRINSAKDDAAGLAIAERMTSQIRGSNQASRNANDGISLAQTAEGDLVQISENLQRMRELAVQAANASNSSNDRAALQGEVAQLAKEIDRVAANSSFNNVKLLDGTFQTQTFQVGANNTANDRITIDSITSARGADLGQSYSATVTSSAVNATAIDGTNVSINTINIKATASDGVSTAGATASAKAKATAINSTSGLNVTATASTTVAGAASTGSAGLTGTITINGVATGVINMLAAGSEATNEANVAAAINAISAATGVTATVTASNGVQMFAADGRNIVHAFTGTLTAGVTGMAAAATSYGKLTLTSKGTSGITAGGTVAILGSPTTTQATKGGTAISNLDISTADNAQLALDSIDAALTAISTSRAALGAYQNRLSSVVSSLQTTTENMTASRSRILDADFAAETASLSRAQILQQAGTAMLAQANQLPQNVLSLLR